MVTWGRGHARSDKDALRLRENSMPEREQVRDVSFPAAMGNCEIPLLGNVQRYTPAQIVGGAENCYGLGTRTRACTLYDSHGML